MEKGYTLIDSGEGKKLEQFGPHILSRPCAQAFWSCQKNNWNQTTASFTRLPDLKWKGKHNLPESWWIEVESLKFKLSPTDFGHLGIFPEQARFWKWFQDVLKGKQAKVLNLFAYSGGSTLACAKAGAEVVHVDASKGMVNWARENAKGNGFEDRPIRWIVEDARKFLAREEKRGNTYDAIILDPPSFGRGKKGEVFKIEEEIIPLLNQCKAVLSDQPLFILFSCHTPGFTPITMHHLLSEVMGSKGIIDFGEMVLEGEKPIPSGTFARWRRDDLNS